MPHRSVALLCLMTMFGIAAYGQRVTGKVTTAMDGNPLPGVSVFVKGTTIGGPTNVDGVYSIAASDSLNSTLIFSFVGFVTQEIPLAGKTIIDVSLKESSRQLDEVVVTALGIPREMKTLVYSTQKVNTEELTDVRDPNNFLNSLSGKVANSVITQSSGGVGSGARIVLRGNRSIQGSNNALIVVDGVPIDNSAPMPGVSSDGASNLNPDDIESMTVLPGASAAALYGSAAGNGAIIIATKKGKSGQVSLTLNSGITSEQVFVLPAVQNEYGQGLDGNVDGTSAFSWGYKSGELLFTGYMGETRKYSPQPDNIKDFFRHGLSRNTYLSVTGGTEKVQTYLSYTQNKVEGVVPNNDLSRHTFTFRASNQIGNKFSTDAKITYVLQSIDRPGWGMAPFTQESLSAVFNMPRNVSIEDAKNFETIGNAGVPKPTPWPDTNNPMSQSPYWANQRTGNTEERTRIMGFIQARYNITKWLDLEIKASLDKTIDQRESFAYQGSAWGHPGGDFAEIRTNVTQNWYDGIISGRNTINNILKVEYRAGAILQDTRYNAANYIATGLNIPNKFSLNFTTNPISYEDVSHVQTQSLFGQVNLAFKESIFLDASLRNDWISTLPPPYTILYPSIGLSAIVSDLVVFPHNISFLKLSANYAEVGNGAPYGIRNNTFSYFPGAGHGFLSRNTSYALEQLRPELVKNVEFGVDARFLENKFGFTFYVYRSNSTNQILYLPITVASGYTNQLINAGNIQNKGLELVVNVTPVKTNKVTWNVAFNLGMNRNQIVELHDDIKEVALGCCYGATPVVAEGKSFGDLSTYGWKKDTLGQYLVTENGLPVWSDTLAHFGNFYPKATLGLTNTVHYDRFSLRLLIDGRIGGVMYSGTELDQAMLGEAEVTAKFREGELRLGGVNEEGNYVGKAVTSQEFWLSIRDVVGNAGEFFIYDATNFRVRELSLSYDVPIPSTFPLKQFRVSAVARNLFFLYRGSSLTDIPGIGKRKMSLDPDMSIHNNNFQGVEYMTLPSSRSIGFNIQMTF